MIATRHDFKTRENIAWNFLNGFPVKCWSERNEVGEFLTLLPGGDSLHRSNLPSGTLVCRTEHVDRAAQVAAAKTANQLVCIGRPAEGIYEVYAI